VAEDQIAFDDFGATLREAEVIEFGADGVRMAFDFGGEAGVILEFLGRFIEDAASQRGEAGAIEFEVDRLQHDAFDAAFCGGCRRGWWRWGRRRWRRGGDRLGK
jgi:hypothetical protein